MLKLIGLGSSMVSKITGKAPKLSYNLAAIACDGHYFCSKKAIQELKMPQTPIETGVLEAKKWFVANNYLQDT